MRASKVPSYTVAHLCECINQLQNIVDELGHPKCTSGIFQAAMAHAYHHLNFAWNTRELKANQISEIDGGDDRLRWFRCEQMPTDLIASMEVQERPRRPFKRVKKVHTPRRACYR